MEFLINGMYRSINENNDQVDVQILYTFVRGTAYQNKAKAILKCFKMLQDYIISKVYQVIFKDYFHISMWK